MGKINNYPELSSVNGDEVLVAETFNGTRSLPINALNNFFEKTDNWRTIIDYTVPSDVAFVEFKQDKDGNPFELKKCKVILSIPISSSLNTGMQYPTIAFREEIVADPEDTESKYYATSIMLSKYASYSAYSPTCETLISAISIPFFECHAFMDAAGLNSYGAQGGYTAKNAAQSANTVYNKMNYFRFWDDDASAAKQIPKGTIIRMWGVDYNYD